MGRRLVVVVQADDPARPQQAGPAQIARDVDELVARVDQDEVETLVARTGLGEGASARGLPQLDAFARDPVAREVALDRGALLGE